MHTFGCDKPLILAIFVTDRNTWITMSARILLELEILILFSELLDGNVLTVVVDYVTKV